MRTHRRIIRCTFFSAAGALLLAACGNDVAEVQEEPIRAIKPFYVSEPAGGDVRRFSGTVQASDTSALSFAVDGTVQTVAVNQGDRVEQGQTLATLDPEPFELDLAAARSQLKSAEAAYANKKAEIDRQAQLYERGWVAKAAYDQAVLAFDSAEADIAYARSRFESAERDLTNATLKAPFDGTIAERSIEPFTEVKAGKTLFAVNSEGAVEIELSVPDTVVSRVSIGLPVLIEATSVSNCGCAARVTEIGSAAGAANAVTVKATILNPPSALLPGMTAEATVMLNGDDEAHGYLVPLVAIAPSDDAEQGYVFKFDQETGTVSRVEVKGRAGRGNLIEVIGGVEAGDILAAAGVSFLRDGQQVKLMGE